MGGRTGLFTGGSNRLWADGLACSLLARTACGRTGWPAHCWPGPPVGIRAGLLTVGPNRLWADGLACRLLAPTTARAKLFGRPLPLMTVWSASGRADCNKEIDRADSGSRSPVVSK